MLSNSNEARFAVNVYLLKKGSEGHLLVEGSGLNQTLDIPTAPDTLATLYYGQVSGSPDWLRRLFALADGATEAPLGASISGMLPIKINDRDLVITFGHAWQKVKAAMVEPNFGIRCVLNLAEEKALRAIRRDRIAEDSLQAIEQIPDSDGISRFGMDVEKDLLRGVKARVDPALGFGAWVAGADSFKASIDLSSEHISNFLLRCLKLYEGSSYKTRFEWVDNISPIRDEGLETALLAKLASQVAIKDPGVTLSVPDLLRWDDHDYFAFQRRKRGQSPCSNYLSLSHWVEFATSCGYTITSDLLKELKIYAYRQGGSEVESWPVLQCLHGVVHHAGGIFLAHAGHWFELSNSFVSETNARVAKIPLSSIKLPKTGVSECEGDYNSRVALSSKGKWLLLDKKLIFHGGGMSKFEVCDLFSEDGHLVCVKQWGGGSGSLSHLFYQAKNAAILINNDEVFRNKVRGYISSADPNYALTWDYVCANPADVEVVLAVMRGCSKESLPFFAKLALCDCVKGLRTMRFSASYLVIDPDISI